MACFGVTTLASCIMSDVAQTVVEIHVPLQADVDVAEGQYQYPWIVDLDEHLFSLEEAAAVEVFDDGEEVGHEYLFFITGKPEDELLRVASTVVARPGVPAGAYAVVTDDEAEEFGEGRRVELPL